MQLKKSDNFQNFDSTQDDHKNGEKRKETHRSSQKHHKMQNGTKFGHFSTACRNWSAKKKSSKCSKVGRFWHAKEKVKFYEKLKKKTKF